MTWDCSRELMDDTTMWSGFSDRVVEDHLAIDVRAMSPAIRGCGGGALEVTWSDGDKVLATALVKPGPLGAASEPREVVIQLQGVPVPEHGPQTVQLDATQCYMGGRRLWWLCPRCSRRRAILYLAGGLFLCRACHGLVYRSTTASGLDRLAARVAKLRAKLGVSGQVDAFGPLSLPDRPRWMHQSTYDRLARDLFRAEIEYQEAVWGWIRRRCAA